MFAIISVNLTAAIYLLTPGFAEQGEINFSAVAALLHQGYPLYTNMDSAERYSLQHGPIAYVAISTIMKLFGASYFTAKLSGVTSFLLGTFISWVWFKKLLSKKDALILLGLEVWILMHWHHIFFSRPDSLMLLCVVVSMYIVTTKESRWLLIAGIAIPLGLMINLKVHGAIYFLPILMLALGKLSWHALLLMGIITSFLAVLPYWHPQISFSNYLVWLSTSVELGKENPGFVLRNLLPKITLIVGLILVPVCIGTIRNISLRAFYKRNKRVIISTLFALIIPTILAAKPGSGTNHLIPFIPTFCYILALLISSNDYKKDSLKEEKRFSRLSVILSYMFLALSFLAFTSGGVGRQASLMQSSFASNRHEVMQEITATEVLYKGKTIEVGYGDYESYVRYRDFVPLPVFHGNPLLVEAVALSDMQAIGLKTPPATIKKLQEGDIQVWLIPIGKEPFGLWAFDDSFRSAFQQNYQLERKLQFFDVWLYKSDKKN